MQLNSTEHRSNLRRKPIKWKYIKSKLKHY